MIVIDVGAQHHPPEESTYFLADRFHPSTLYAFDIGRGFQGGIERYKEVLIVRRRAAAWVSDGFQPYRDAGMCSSVRPRGDRQVESFDLAAFIRHLDERVILKLDCEGAEYVLLPHLADAGVDSQIDLLLIEWHPPHLANGWYAPRPELACEIVDWNDLTGLPTEAEPTSLARELA